jgi:hypothetical protein
MKAKGQQTLAMIQYDEVALERKWPRQQHRTVIHGSHWSSAGHSEIQTQVGA